MSLEQRQTPRKPRRFLTKRDLCTRYNWKTPLSVDRNWKIYKTIPGPTRFLGRKPLWDEEILDQWDAQAPRTSSVILPQEKLVQNLDRARKARATKIKRKRSRAGEALAE